MIQQAQRHPFLAAEFVLLFLAFPVTIDWFGFRVKVIPVLWGLSACCCVVLALDRSFDKRAFFSTKGFSTALRWILPRWIVLSAAGLLFVVLYEPYLLFRFARERTGLYFVVMCLYPLLSVYPQGIIYRGFIFHRYQRLFGSQAMMVVASAVAFSISHIVLGNWIAPIFTLAGGLLFAETYRRTQSLFIASFEHYLYGGWMFTVGLGPYFYAGTRQFIAQG